MRVFFSCPATAAVRFFRCERRQHFQHQSPFHQHHGVVAIQVARSFRVQWWLKLLSDNVQPLKVHQTDFRQILCDGMGYTNYINSHMMRIHCFHTHTQNAAISSAANPVSPLFHVLHYLYFSFHPWLLLGQNYCRCCSLVSQSCLLANHCKADTSTVLSHTYGQPFILISNTSNDPCELRAGNHDVAMVLPHLRRHTG
jgi:hypothetical protein